MNNIFDKFYTFDDYTIYLNKNYCNNTIYLHFYKRYRSVDWFLVKEKNFWIFKEKYSGIKIKTSEINKYNQCLPPLSENYLIEKYPKIKNKLNNLNKYLEKYLNKVYKEILYFNYKNRKLLNNKDKKYIINLKLIFDEKLNFDIFLHILSFFLIKDFSIDKN